MTASTDLATLAMLAEVFTGGVEPGWWDSALCAQVDTEVFYPEKGASAAEAKRICWGCEVRTECLEDALKNRERFGIWGGTSERERRKLLARPTTANATEVAA